MGKGTNALMAASLLAMQAGLPETPIIQPRKVKEPRMPLTDEEIEMLASFPEDKEGRKAKKKYVRELELKYADHSRSRATG